MCTTVLSVSLFSSCFLSFFLFLYLYFHFFCSLHPPYKILSFFHSLSLSFLLHFSCFPFLFPYRLLNLYFSPIFSPFLALPLLFSLLLHINLEITRKFYSFKVKFEVGQKERIFVFQFSWKICLLVECLSGQKMIRKFQNSLFQLCLKFRVADSHLTHLQEDVNESVERFASYVRLWNRIPTHS
jgi:hypothetical protein